MPCIGEIDAGSREAQAELLFLMQLIEALRGVDPSPEIAGCFVSPDIYRVPAMRAGDFIRVNKPSQEFLELLSALRARAYDYVINIVEGVVAHGEAPKRACETSSIAQNGAVSPSCEGASSSFCAT
jgi:hypothetical protein